MPAREVSVRAYAKINLGLRVLYKRPDNYHEIRTVFQTVSLADRLTIRYNRASATNIALEGNVEIEDNLVTRAARLVLDELRLTARVQFTLEKRIPMGAGLGGGSSDAAAVLLALPVLAGGAIPVARLSSLAASLGSDVPFFLWGGAALGLGRGEELYPLPDLPRLAGVIVAPGIHVSTPEAYRDLSQRLSPADLPDKLSQFQECARNPLSAPAVNDFEPPVFERHPVLFQLKNRLSRLGAKPALMSGSGSSIFGLFHQKETVAHVVQSVSGGNVHPVFLLTGAAYRRDWLRRLKPHIKGELWPPRSRYAR